MPLTWVGRPIGVPGSRLRVLEEGDSIRWHILRQAEPAAVCVETFFGVASSKTET